MNEVQAIGTAFVRIGKVARPSTTLVYAAFLMLLDPDHGARVPIREIVTTSGQSRGTVQRAIRQLIALGRITATRPHSGWTVFRLC